MNSNKLLDTYKTHHGVESDYSLAAHLHVTRSTVHTWRKRGLPERLAFHFAMELHLDPAAVLAAVRADHATDAAIKKTWEKVAKTMASRAAVFVFGVVALLTFSAPQPALASISNGQEYTLYALRRWLCLFFNQLYGIPKNLTLRIKAFLAFFLHRPQQLKLI